MLFGNLISIKRMEQTKRDNGLNEMITFEPFLHLFEWIFLFLLKTQQST